MEAHEVQTVEEIIRKLPNCKYCGAPALTCDCITKRCGRCSDVFDHTLEKFEVWLYDETGPLGGDVEWLCEDCHEFHKEHPHRYHIWGLMDGSLMPAEICEQIVEHLLTCRACRYEARIIFELKGENNRLKTKSS